MVVPYVIDKRVVAKDKEVERFRKDTGFLLQPDRGQEANGYKSVLVTWLCMVWLYGAGR